MPGRVQNLRPQGSPIGRSSSLAGRFRREPHPPQRGPRASGRPSSSAAPYGGLAGEVSELGLILAGRRARLTAIGVGDARVCLRVAVVPDQASAVAPRGGADSHAPSAVRVHAALRGDARVCVEGAAADLARACAGLPSRAIAVGEAPIDRTLFPAARLEGARRNTCVLTVGERRAAHVRPCGEVVCRRGARLGLQAVAWQRGRSPSTARGDDDRRPAVGVVHDDRALPTTAMKQTEAASGEGEGSTRKAKPADHPLTRCTRRARSTSRPSFRDPRCFPTSGR
jgi:hypothetical protein